MKNKNGIWASTSVTTPGGEIIVSIRLDTAIDPEVVCARLDKKSDTLSKQMDKILNKMNLFNDKTPQKIIDLTIKEMINIHNQQSHNNSEYLRWSEVW